MYRRLVTFALLVVTVAVTALVIPLALSARDLVRSANLATLSDEARQVADLWEAHRGSGEDHSDAPVIDPPDSSATVVLVYPDGTVVGGPVPTAAQGVVASAQQGRSASLDSDGQGYAGLPGAFRRSRGRGAPGRRP